MGDVADVNFLVHQFQEADNVFSLICVFLVQLFQLEPGRNCSRWDGIRALYANFGCLGTVHTPKQ